MRNSLKKNAVLHVNLQWITKLYSVSNALRLHQLWQRQTSEILLNVVKILLPRTVLASSKSSARYLTVKQGPWKSYSLVNLHKMLCLQQLYNTGRCNLRIRADRLTLLMTKNSLCHLKQLRKMNHYKADCFGNSNTIDTLMKILAYKCCYQPLLFQPYLPKG